MKPKELLFIDRNEIRRVFIPQEEWERIVNNSLLYVPIGNEGELLERVRDSLTVSPIPKSLKTRI